MKKLLTNPITYCVLFVACIGVLSSFDQTQTPPKQDYYKKYSLQEITNVTQPLTQLYQYIDDLDCISVGQNKSIKSTLANAINGLNAKPVDSTLVNKK